MYITTSTIEHEYMLVEQGKGIEKKLKKVLNPKYRWK